MFVIFFYFFLVYGSLDIGKVKKIWLLHAYIYSKVILFKLYPVVFKHFWLSLAACVINFHLEHSFYIDTNKNIIPISTLWKWFFLFFTQCLVKKMKHPSFLIHFGRRIHDKWWLWAGLCRCDRLTVVLLTNCLSVFEHFVRPGWLRRSPCNRTVINWYELKASQCHFEMSKSITSNLIASVKIEIKCKTLRRRSLISYQPGN